MKALIAIRERLKAFYMDYSAYMLPVLKFALAVIIFTIINNRLGYMEALNKLFILIILAAISAILPLNGMVVIGMALIVLHSFGLGLEVGLFALILFVLLGLLYFRFVPRDAPVMLLGPIACNLHLQAALPLCLGLLRGPESALSAICGLISWRYMEIIHTTIAPMKEKEDAGLIAIIQLIPKQLFSPQLILYMVAFAATAVVVALICRYLTTFTRLVALLIGTGVYLVLMIAGNRALKAEVDLKWLVLGTLLSLLVALFLNVFVYTVDYARSKFIQFEDEHYYYYVKAIPKMTADGVHDEPIFEDEHAAFAAEAEDAALASDVAGAKTMRFDGVDFETKLEDSLKGL